MKYAGIGARRTPDHILQLMYEIAVLLAIDGHTLSTGAAKGADQAFADGANELGGLIELFLPWASYESEWRQTLGNTITEVYNENVHRDAMFSVRMHPTYDKLTQGAKRLHARNYLILLGCKLVICWTEEGAIVGGTGQAIRLAEAMKIPVHNLGCLDVQKIYSERVDARRKELETYLGRLL